VIVGTLRHPASYQEPTDAVDTLGQEAPASWAEVYPVRCGVRSPNGREAMIASTMRSTADHVVTHRFCGSVPNPRGRYVLEDGRVFEVVSSSDPDERRREVVSYCVEIRIPTV
jgi:head-tail adaptor